MDKEAKEGMVGRSSVRLVPFWPNSDGRFAFLCLRFFVLFFKVLSFLCRGRGAVPWSKKWVQLWPSCGKSSALSELQLCLGHHAVLLLSAPTFRPWCRVYRAYFLLFAESAALSRRVSVACPD